MNSIIIMGTMTRDVELKYLPSGSAIGKFSIAVNQNYVKDGQKVEKSSFFEVTAFGKQAETINQYFNKGSRILINGELDHQTWEKDGQKQSKVIIKLDKFYFVDKKSDSGSQKTVNYEQQKRQTQPKQEVPTIDFDDDSLPF